MKAKFDTLIGIVAVSMAALSCSAPRYVAAQTDDGYYTQQPPVAQQPVMQQPKDDGYNDQGAQVEDQQDVDFNSFYDALSPYGDWQNDPEYGQVWTSNEPGFTPYYSNGNWAYSDAGWAWVSNYSWGWAPFHYGRWAFRGHWMWVPGYDWAPAWVSWRTGGDYYGWAPLGPGINVGAGVGYGGFIAPERWNFCPRNYITSGHFNNYCIDRSRNITVINNTTVINNVNTYRNTRFVAGPERRDVERYTNSRINPMPIRNAGRPGATTINRGAIQMYRPNVRPGNNQRAQGGQRNIPQQPNNYRPQQNNQQQGRPQQVQPQYRPQQNQPAPAPVNTQPRQPIRNTDRQQGAFNNSPANDRNREVAFNNGQPQRTAERRIDVQPIENRPQARQQQTLPQQQAERPVQQAGRPVFNRPQAPQQQRVQPFQQQVRPQVQQRAQPVNSQPRSNNNNDRRIRR